MLKNVELKAKEVGSAKEAKRLLKNVQSRKCRLKKRKDLEDYEVKMNEILKEEQLLKEVRDYFEPKEKPVTEYTLEDVEKLNYDETIKAIKSIQSKKCNVQFLTKDINENEEYQNALKIEEMLKEHKEKIKPIDDYVVRKSQIQNLINHLENQEEKISKEYVIEQLENLIK